MLLLQATANVQDLAKRLKQSEHTVGELQRQSDESSGQLQNALAENQKLAAELTRSRIIIKELEEKVDALARENKQLSGQLLSPVLLYVDCVPIDAEAAVEIIYQEAAINRKIF